MDREHHLTLWFPDGNIILSAASVSAPCATVLFRVHGFLLARHSNVFRDMLCLSAPPQSDDDTYEGLPVVVMQDTAVDVECMLDALYNPW